MQPLVLLALTGGTPTKEPVKAGALARAHLTVRVEPHTEKPPVSALCSVQTRLRHRWSYKTGAGTGTGAGPGFAQVVNVTVP